MFILSLILYVSFSFCNIYLIYILLFFWMLKSICVVICLHFIFTNTTSSILVPQYRWHFVYRNGIEKVYVMVQQSWNEGILIVSYPRTHYKLSQVPLKFEPVLLRLHYSALSPWVPCSLLFFSESIHQRIGLILIQAVLRCWELGFNNIWETMCCSALIIPKT